MAARLRASIIVIGDEILGGFVADTNSGWLAGRLQALGVPLDRIVTVPDEFDAIGEALDAELGRSRPRVVFTSGGIGSTPDDLTVEAVARYLGVGTAVAPEIDERITRALEWTAGHGMTVTSAHERAMRKMALVPGGARLLAGGAGVTPGVAVEVDGGPDDGGAVVVVLPGVPSELKRIVTEGIEEAYLAGRGRPDHVVELRHPYPESVLTPLFEQLVDDFPEVHLGSYPGPECTVRLLGPEERVEAVAALVEAHVAALGEDPGMRRLSEAWRSRWSS